MHMQCNTWQLEESEIAILRMISTTMIRAMCGAKSIKKRNSLILIDMLDLEEPLGRLDIVLGAQKSLCRFLLTYFRLPFFITNKHSYTGTNLY